MVETPARTTHEAKQPFDGRQQVMIYALQTGWVRVRPQQIRGVGHGIGRRIRTFAGRGWSPWLPIHAWLIDHPDGLVLVDTGETACTAEPGYFPGWHPYYRRGVEFRVGPEDEIGQQLRKHGFDPTDVKQVIMTHLHTDHAGGLHHFPDSEILVEPEDFKRASGIRGRLQGFLPHRFPEWLAPQPIRFSPRPFGPFERSLPVTSDESIIVVPTPGHTAGHVSVIVRDRDVTYFLAGDTSYNEELMVAGQVDGVAPDDGAAARTLTTIRALARQEPLVYLPSHDPESEKRLTNQQTVGL